MSSNFVVHISILRSKRTKTKDRCQLIAWVHHFFFLILLIIVLLHSPFTNFFCHTVCTSTYLFICENNLSFFLLPTQHHSKDEQKKKKNEPNPNFLEFNPNLRIKIRARLKNINPIKFGLEFESLPT